MTTGSTGSSTARRANGPAHAPDADSLEALAERLAAEMADLWRRGERPRAEEFLARHPVLWDEPEAAAGLIYEEVCLRQEHGDRAATADALARFPQWRGPLEVLFRFHQLVDPDRPAPSFPSVGESLNEFVLLAELGRGARGRVFLAAQRSLADRPVVLKVTPRDGDEHICLARLQHTNIVPLHSVGEDPARDLRVLCMPYFGGATLDRVLEGLRAVPPADRTGGGLLRLIDAAVAAPDAAPVARGPGRAYLEAAGYDHAVCWVGAQLADALQYAHDRDLVHLDVKPSNVLVTADGQAMLLDFHLARPPVRPAEPSPDRLGGTPAYMSPEQRAAYEAVRTGRPIPFGVDGRSDVYSLALVLYEALGGPVPFPAGGPPRLDRLNRRVSVGLADIVHKCLAPDPADRYQRADLLAADLHRHLDDLSLRGVRNRSWRERWAKWRRRSPYRVPQLATAVAVLLAVGGMTAAVLNYTADQADFARQRLEEGTGLRERGRYADAERALDEGRAVARRLPFHRELADRLTDQWNQTRVRRAEEERRAAVAREVQDLHRFVDRVRFLYGSAARPTRGLDQLVAQCGGWWDRRDRLTDGAGGLPPEAREQVRRDLLDLAILWMDLRGTLAGEPTAVAAEASAVFDEAQRRFGSSPVLERERRRYAGPSSPAPGGASDAGTPGPRTAWEYYALGRSHLRDGDPAAAAAALRQAVALEPQGLWPNFYSGVCAFRLARFEDAVAAFTACVSLAPASAECYYNRGLAYARLKRHDRAVDDYSAALRLAPGLGPAALNRGIIHFHEGRHPEAAADFRYALANGTDPGPAHYNLALVHHARGEREQAVRELEAALRHAPESAAARDLLDRLRAGR